jgi:hypothetical protein
MQKLQGLNIFIGWSVGFSVGVVWAKGGNSFGRKRDWFWVSVRMNVGAVCNGKSVDLGRDLSS